MGAPLYEVLWASGTNAWKIARVALENDKSWSDQIDAWQKPYLENDSQPDWFRSELFNEMYIVADGGTSGRMK